MPGCKTDESTSDFEQTTKSVILHCFENLIKTSVRSNYMYLFNMQHFFLSLNFFHE